MTLDTIMVEKALTKKYATHAVVLGWADKRTNGTTDNTLKQ